MGKKSPCEGCIYWKNLSSCLAAKAPRYCAYCHDTGHCRPCEPGEGCIVRKEKTNDRN